MGRWALFVSVRYLHLLHCLYSAFAALDVQNQEHARSAAGIHNAAEKGAVSLEKSDLECREMNRLQIVHRQGQSPYLQGKQELMGEMQRESKLVVTRRGGGIF